MKECPKFGSETVLCAMSMVPVGFRDLVDAAAAAGFRGISLAHSVYRRGRTNDGLSDSDMRAILADHDLVLTDVEAASCWLSPPETTPPRWRQGTADEELIRIAEALSARTLVATHFGDAAPLDVAAERFARLCDDAARSGLQVALEFVAVATIKDVATAWDVVRLADRPNGGILVDTWHHRRSTSDDSALAAVPPERILSVQLADGTAEPIGTLEEDIIVRRMPGEGDFGLADLVRRMADAGVRAPIGVETWDKQLLSQGPARAAERLATTLQSVLAQATSPR